MLTPLIDYPRPILDFEVKPYTQKQDFVTNPDRFRGFPAVGEKLWEPRIICRNNSPPLYVRNYFFYRAGIAESDIKFQFWSF